MSQKTVLVTGGAGFIGSHFVELVRRVHPDWRIVVVDCLSYSGSLANIPDEVKGSDEFYFWQGNVCNADLMSDLVRMANYVVHFAAETHVARSIFENRAFFETDVIGTQCVATAVMKNDNVERFVHISTSEVYGTALANPMDEEHPLNPMSPYAAAKAGADRLVYAYCQTYRIPAVIVRPFNQYGPRQHLEKLIPRVITSVLLGEDVHIHGSGTQERDWAYVTDTCENVLKFLDMPAFERVAGQVFNIGTGRCISVRGIVDRVLRIMDVPTKVENIGERPGNVQRHISSNDRFRELVGPLVDSDFDERLEETIRWYRDNPDAWKGQTWLRTIPIRMVDGTIERH